MDNETIQAQYDELLNETNEPVVVGGLTFEPARVMRELDPIAYHLGLQDYINSLENDAP